MPLCFASINTAQPACYFSSVPEGLVFDTSHPCFVPSLQMKQFCNLFLPKPDMVGYGWTEWKCRLKLTQTVPWLFLPPSHWWGFLALIGVLQGQQPGHFAVDLQIPQCNRLVKEIKTPCQSQLLNKQWSSNIILSFNYLHSIWQFKMFVKWLEYMQILH